MGFLATGSKMIGRGVMDYYYKSEEAEKIIIRHSCVAGAAALIPIPYADMAVCLPNQIALYGFLNKELGVSLSKELLKVIGGFMISQITGMISVFPFVFAGKVAAGLLKFIPLAGSIGGFLIDGAINAGITYVLGIVYLKAMVNVLKAGKPINESSLKEALKAEFDDTEGIKNIYKEGKQKLKGKDFSAFRDDAEKYSGK